MNQDIWDRLDKVSTFRLTSYLKNEYPQVVGVILFNLSRKTVAGVMDELPENFAMEVVMRMLRTDDVRKEVIDIIEDTLQDEFFNNVVTYDNKEKFIGDMFDVMVHSDHMVEQLEERNREMAEKVKGYMDT